MGRAVKRHILSPRGWVLAVTVSLAAVLLAWTAAVLCVQLMSG
jgi:hypothetical protein